ncbi:MAG: hypothetical protein K0M66_05240 [Thiobacillus sp.]|nr:hypothetical protein [Thiobacillus sp.]
MTDLKKKLMTVVAYRIVLVDTNCFLRLYQSPASPLLGQDIGGYRLLTLGCLIDEFLENPALVLNYRWISSKPIIDEVQKAKLKISEIYKRKVRANSLELKLFADTFIRDYCRKRKIVPRGLSSRDLELLGTAIVLKCVIATDEWPLTQVSKELMEDPDYEIEIFNSLDVLSILESHGRLSADERRQTVDSWKRLSEKLPRDWEAQYQLLFGEAPGSPDEE